ncbi:MAG TPA: MurR/RpiR family transcriptional regulator [Candidatus Limnocylindria bacterium]|jgi:RpiR family carbohydrate utilization transcriptional regulator|nr:MurR/RpiR family transcriptional regulator [Candidatus Limnocylindria bacterium]
MAIGEARVDPVKVPGSFIRLQGAYSGLRAAEQRVADFILAHPDELIYLTVTELAERTNTSESTVVRLCQKIGYKGYQEFKIVLARDLVEPTTEIYAAIEPNDDVQTVKQKVFQANAQALRDTIEVLDDGELQKAVDALTKARRVDIYGVGGSGPLALDAYHKFLKLGMQAVALSDGDLMAMSSALLGPGDVAFGISHTGASRDVTDALNRAKSGGATTICITHRSSSPITKVSDIVLVTAAKQTAFRSDASSSRIAQLTIIDTLYVGVAHNNHDKAIDMIEKTREATASKRY